MGKVEGGAVEAGEAYVTLDGSWVRELVRPERGGPRNVSLAEAVLQPGERTRPHSHRLSDEVYYVLGGEGVVMLGANSYAVEPGSCLLLPAGRLHSARCTGQEALRLLCICAPPYTHEQTDLAD